MPVARPDSGETRVIAHLDLDCFYVQVEQRKRPELRGKPVAVVQFNPWKGGGLIAVSYEARKCGVLRIMRGDDARKICPDIELVQVPTAHGHANVSCYRDAGTEVVEVLSRGGLLERASIDEVYLDLTEAAAARLLKDPPLTVDSVSEEARKTHILGLAEDGGNAMTAGEWLCQTDSPRCDALLACGALIVAELRAAVLAETQFTCSAGIGHNKMLAKLTSSMHKPAQQTLIPASYVPTLLATIPLKKIGHLGGKLGKSLVEDLDVKTPGDLLQFSQQKLQELYGVNTGSWLWNVARGKNGDEVKRRDFAKSHSAGKTFAGRTALTSMDSVMHWLGEMCEELQERLDLDLEMHNRKAKLLVFHAAVHLRGGSQPAKKFPSKSGPIRYGKEKMMADARVLFERGLRDFCPPNKSLSPVKGSGNKCEWAVTALSIGASGMSTLPTGVNPITSFFAAPSRSSLIEASLPALTSCQATTSASDLEPGQGHCQVTEELGPSSRAPSSNDLEEMASVPSDNDKVTGTFKVSSLLASSSCRKLFNSDEDADADQDVDADQVVDVSCTPTFGRIGSPIPQTNYLQTLNSDSFHTSSRSSASSANPRDDLEPALIQCSPVECPTSEAENCDTSDVSFTPDMRVRVEKEDEKATRAVLSRIDSEALGATQDHPSRIASGLSKATALPKLKDLWLRNVEQSGLKRQPASSNWEYKQEEIDEEVLAQLPPEIQKELLDSLKRQQRPLQRPTKRPNISDFFPSSSK